MNKFELISKKIISPCDCWACNEFSPNIMEHNSLVYKILDTAFTMRQLMGVTTYWRGCPRNIDSIPFLFEEIFDSVDDYNKTILIFNLNNFKKAE